MKVPTRNSKYSFNLKIFKLHNDKKPTSPSPPTSPVISAKRNSWRASWRSALGSKSKSIAMASDSSSDPIDLEAEPVFFEHSWCNSYCSSSSAFTELPHPAIQIPQGDELMCKLADNMCSGFGISDWPNPVSFVKIVLNRA